MKYIRKGIDLYLPFDDSIILKKFDDFTLETSYFIFKDNSIGNAYAYDVNSEPICYAITIDQAERWLRENRNIHFIIHFDIDKITYTISVTENIIYENTEVLLPGMKNPIHFDPNNIFFRGETHTYENLDDAKADAIHLALKYLSLGKDKYHDYYGKYLENKN